MKKEGKAIFKEYPDIVSVEQLCKMLHIGKNTAYNLLKSGMINTIRVGRQYRIPKKEVIKYINS